MRSLYSVGGARSKLALLGLPVLGMMGLFAWAGAGSASTPSGTVEAFISALNRHDCATMLSYLRPVHGRTVPSCVAIAGPRGHHVRLEDCTLTTRPPVVTSVPAGYTDPAGVVATCAEMVPGGVTRSGVGVSFLVATSRATGGEVILVEAAPHSASG